jgi:hypothetical protein
MTIIPAVATAAAIIEPIAVAGIIIAVVPAIGRIAIVAIIIVAGRSIADVHAAISISVVHTAAKRQR